MVNRKLKIVIFAYPDNPAGSYFVQSMLNHKIHVSAVLVETKSKQLNWKRAREKIAKDGFKVTLQRITQIMELKRTGKTVVQIAHKNGIPVYEVKNMNSHICADYLDQFKPDLIVIASAPILKKSIFSKARLGCLNAHPGWLPKYRGIGANAYAVFQGDLPGITIHWIDDGIDTGNIIIRKSIKVLPKDSIAKINDRATRLGAEMMADVIKKIECDDLKSSKVHEPKGKLYRAMPYKEVKKINKKLKSKVNF
jgi:methionyl-tRNA formyltransferase